jgi:SagB-type dehydrogenase family enzyme
MKINYGKVFHKNSNYSRVNNLLFVPKDRNKWPKSWKTIEYKNYNTLKVALPSPISCDFNNDILLAKRSVRDFSHEVINLQQLSNILYYSLGEQKYKGSNFRAHPSAGARYPIEVYVFNFNLKDLKKDFVYHYDYQKHCLSQVASHNDRTKFFGNFKDIELASCAIVLTMIPDRVTRKYGQRGYFYSYIEAGIILDALHTNTFINKAKSCVLGAVEEVNIDQLLNLDPDIETTVLSLMIGG